MKKIIGYIMLVFFGIGIFALSVIMLGIYDAIGMMFIVTICTFWIWLAVKLATG